MGFSINRAIVVGHLGKEVQLGYTQGGKAWGRMTVATSERFKNNDGDWKERTEWHNVTLWGGIAEWAANNLSKGDKVAVSGRLETRSWEGRDGHKNYSTSIVAEDLTGFSAAQERGKQAQGDNRRRRDDDHEPATQITDDDVPF